MVASTCQALKEVGPIQSPSLWSIILAGEMSRKLVMTELLSSNQEEQWKGKVYGTTRAYSRDRSLSGAQGHGSHLLIEGGGDTWVHEVAELGTGLWGGPEAGSLKSSWHERARVTEVRRAGTRSCQIV